MRLPRTLFTNVGLTEDGDVCWEGMEPVPEGNLTDWHRNPGWRPGDKEKSNPGENHPVTTALCSGGQSSPRLTPASASFYLTEVRKRLMNRMGLGHGSIPASGIAGVVGPASLSIQRLLLFCCCDALPGCLHPLQQMSLCRGVPNCNNVALLLWA